VREGREAARVLEPHSGGAPRERRCLPVMAAEGRRHESWSCGSWRRERWSPTRPEHRASALLAYDGCGREAARGREGRRHRGS
jgi:hypothetical protein